MMMAVKPLSDMYPLLTVSEHVCFMYSNLWWQISWVRPRNSYVTLPARHKTKSMQDINGNEHQKVCRERVFVSCSAHKRTP